MIKTKIDYPKSPSIEKVLEMKPLEESKTRELDFILDQMFKQTDVYQLQALKHLFFTKLGTYLTYGYNITEYWRRYICLTKK